jgi:hypothetical protein
MKGGIENRGRTCYMSASLQILLRFEPFHIAVTKLGAHPNGGIIFQFLSAMSDQLLSQTFISPDSLINLFSINQCSPFDIVEFLYRLLGCVFQNCNYASEITALFFFRFRSENDPSKMQSQTF